MKYFLFWFFGVVVIITLNRINPSYWHYDLFDAIYFFGVGILTGAMAKYV